MKKKGSIIFTTILVCLLGFCVIWSISNFDKLKLAISGTSLYTKEDVDNAYRDGYDTAVTDKSDLLVQIETLRNELDIKTAELSALKNKLADYDAITTENHELKQEIKALEKEIENLNLTISAYEKFVEDVEEADKLVATFMYDGAIYALQRYENGATISIEDPVSTEDVKFLGWTKDGADVDLTNYVITESVTFEAKLAKSSAVTFTVKGETFDSQRVAYGESPVLPSETPDVYGYTFLGWSKDGVNVVDVTSDVIESTTNYVALFELFEVKIEFKGEFKSVGHTVSYYEILTDIPWEMEEVGSPYPYAFYYTYTEYKLGVPVGEDVGVLYLIAYETPGDFSTLVEISDLFCKNTSWNNKHFSLAEQPVTFYLVDPTV